MEVTGEEEVGFDPHEPDAPPPLAQAPIAPGSSQQGDLPLLDDPPGIAQEPSQEPPPTPAQAASAASSDEHAR
eukprot:2208331-Pyramimonas_sp.AAC.1